MGSQDMVLVVVVVVRQDEAGTDRTQQYVNMLFVLGIGKISTGPRTLHIIFNTSSGRATRAQSDGDGYGTRSGSGSESGSARVGSGQVSKLLAACGILREHTPFLGSSGAFIISTNIDNLKLK